MADIERIIKAIDEFLERKHQKITTPVEINPYLEKIGLLNDSLSRPGLPVRKILRKGQIPHAYQIGVNWQIPHSGKSQRNLKPILNSNSEKETKPKKIISTNGHKLTPIGNLIINLIEEKYNKKPPCFYEYKPDWLLSNPTKQLIEKRDELSLLYAELTENKFSLIEKISELTDKKLKQKQHHLSLPCIYLFFIAKSYPALSAARFRLTTSSPFFPKSFFKAISINP